MRIPGHAQWRARVEAGTVEKDGTMTLLRCRHRLLLYKTFMAAGVSVEDALRAAQMRLRGWKL